MKDLVIQYFEDNPSAKDDVMKAYYAYHTFHPMHGEGFHNFSGPWRDCICEWCGRSRELVRWDSLPAKCQKAPNNIDIAEVILNEEIKTWKLLERAKSEVPFLLKKYGGMNGKTLSILYHTHGYLPEIVEDVCPIDSELIEEFYIEMTKEKTLSRNVERDRKKALLGIKK